MKIKSGHEVRLSWDDVENELDKFAMSIRSVLVNTHRILAVSRGGLPIAAMLSHKAAIRHVHSVQVASYEGSADAYVIPKERQCEWNYNTTLILDDIVDTGDTFITLRHMYPNAVFAALYAKVRGVVHTDHYSKIVPDHYWLVFPWEL